MTDYRVLVVDDEESICRLIGKELHSQRRSVQTAGSGEAARKLVRGGHFDVAVLDIYLPDTDGLSLLEELKSECPETEFILITGYGTISSAVEAMKLGAYDYLTKPFQLERLEFVIEKAYQRARLQQENRLLRQEQKKQQIKDLVGNTQAIKEVRNLIHKVAHTEVPVLLTGESGTGKDVSARAIHAASRRSDKPLVVKNCAALQKDLARSELFGHCKGAFTGATENQEGLLSSAHQGTLFLDEIGELPIEVQGSLLRVLETQTFRRVGSKEEQQVDVRFIFATHRNLAREVSEGRFLEALYHRIAVFTIGLPELKKRKEDLPLLVEYLLGRIRPDRKLSVTRQAMSCLASYHWPGNVRELKNVLERSAILSENDQITHRDLPQELVGSMAEAQAGENGCSLQDAEKRHIRWVLEQCGFNRSQTAAALGCSRKTLYRKMRHYDLLDHCDPTET